MIMATETDLRNFIVANQQRVRNCNNQLACDPPNKAELVSRRAQLMHDIREAQSRLFSLKTGNHFYAVNMDGLFFSLGHDGFTWQSAIELRTVLSQIDLETALYKYLGSSWQTVATIHQIMSI